MTRSIIMIMLLIVTSVTSVFSQQTTSSVNISTKKGVTFLFGGTTAQNNFGSMETLDNDNFFVKGSSSSSLNSHVALINVNTGLVWEKNVFSRQIPSEMFSGDAYICKVTSETLFYATTRDGVDVYNSYGILQSSTPVSGMRSKLIQRKDNNLFLTKVINGSAYMYKLVNNAVVDSVLLLSGVQDILSRSYEATSNSWYLTARLIGVNTVLIKVSLDSGLVWQKTYNNTDRSWVASSADRVYVVTLFFDNNWRPRTRVTAYNFSGDEMWSSNYVPSSVALSDSLSLPKNITLYPNGGCTIVGVSGSDLNVKGNFVATYDINGTLLWETTLTNEGWKSARSVAWNNNKELVVAGNDQPGCYVNVYSVDGVTSVDEPSSAIPNDFVLHQNYPNPFNPTTKISYELPVSTQVQLVVYNQLGQQVAELINGYVSSGSHEVTFDGSGLASGMYFARLVVGANAQTKKMVLVK